MTRKDFVLIADALKAARDEAQSIDERDGVDNAIRNMASALRRTNPRFDYNRFTTACNYQGEGN